ncbi:hypothetical protein [Actinomadura sp. J1-007]|uniref:hypothetical protein n=1 Tax=Actinomadura sp. J1-007 TaxID=2661913 RepID=UPI001F4FDC7E|nr:hypothetical protein [Actinomadura sp. J1-007]
MLDQMPAPGEPQRVAPGAAADVRDDAGTRLGQAAREDLLAALELQDPLAPAKRSRSNPWE